MLSMRLLSTATRINTASSTFTAARWTVLPHRQPRVQHQQLLVRRFASKTFNFSRSKESSDHFFKRAWTKYNVLLETHPLTTKIVTGGTIAAIGDVNCQVFLEPDQPFSVKRVAIFSLLSGVFISPILHGWYRFLTRAVPGTANSAIVKRLALDQLVFAPCCLPVFFTALLTLEGNADKVPEKLAQEWWPAVKTNWWVWVPAQLINFRFVPGNLQVLFSNVMGLFWNSYLSYISHTDAHVALEPVKATTTEVLEPVMVMTEVIEQPVGTPLLAN